MVQLLSALIYISLNAVFGSFDRFWCFLLGCPNIRFWSHLTLFFFLSWTRQCFCSSFTFALDLLSRKRHLWVLLPTTRFTLFITISPTFDKALESKRKLVTACYIRASKVLKGILKVLLSVTENSKSGVCSRNRDIKCDSKSSYLSS